jgi:hypothetical protein
MGHKKGANGEYHISGHSYSVVRGSRPQVMHGTAYKTVGGLTKSSLMYNKYGRIVSRRKHATAKRENRLKKAGWVPIGKGKFGSVFIGDKSKSSKKSSKGRTRRGSPRKSRRSH